MNHHVFKSSTYQSNPVIVVRVSMDTSKTGTVNSWFRIFLMLPFCQNVNENRAEVVAHCVTPRMVTLCFQFTCPTALWELQFLNLEPDYLPNRSKTERIWYPHLYDYSHQDYKDTQKTQSSWRDIRETVWCIQEEAMTAGSLPVFNMTYFISSTH